MQVKAVDVCMREPAPKDNPKNRCTSVYDNTEDGGVQMNKLFDFFGLE